MTTRVVNRFNIEQRLPLIIKDIHAFDPHFVLFSGDITWSGKREEYDRVITDLLIPLCGSGHMREKRVIFAPGNHDIDWDTLGQIRRDIAGAVHGQDDMTDLLATSPKLQLLLAPQAQYREFVCEFSQTAFHRDTPNSMACAIELKGKGKRISVVSLSSILLSVPEAKQGTREPDYGCLAIGEYQARNAIAALCEDHADLRIVMTHHPISYLADWDRDVVERFFTRNFDMHLCGHRHAPSFRQSTSADGKLLSIQTGSLFSGYHSECLYTRFAWYLNANRVNITSMKLSPRDLTCQPENESLDVAIGPDVATGARVLDIPITLSHYRVNLSPQMESDLRSANVSTEELLALTEQAFRGHINYFRRDYENLPIQIKSNLCLIVSKFGSEIDLLRVKRCAVDDFEKLNDWTSIILEYRKATYFAFRGTSRGEPPNPRELRTAIEHHANLRRLIRDFFDVHEGATCDYEGESGAESPPLLRFHLRASYIACANAAEYLKNRRIYAVEEALGEVVVGLEASLMNLHKLVIAYFPGDDANCLWRAASQ